MVSATVREETGPVPVVVTWSLLLPPDRQAADVAQDIYLLWPGEIRNDAPTQKPDAALARYVTDRGFDVIGEGRAGLLARGLADGATEVQAAGAPFVTFVQTGALGLSPPATFIRIPWTPRLADRSWLMELTLNVAGLVKPQKLGWVETIVRGGPSRVAIGFNEVRDRPLFPMYLAHRDRVVHLADAPAELVVQFPQSERLKIDEVYPPTSIRRLSETLDSTQVVSLFLDSRRRHHPAAARGAVRLLLAHPDRAAGGRPAPHLRPRPGDGSAAGARPRAPDRRGGRARAARRVARRARPRAGVILAREVLERIVPGKTTLDEVIGLCGPPVERQEQFPGLRAHDPDLPGPPAPARVAPHLRLAVHGAALGRGAARGADRARGGHRARRARRHPPLPAGTRGAPLIGIGPARQARWCGAALDPHGRTG